MRGTPEREASERQITPGASACRTGAPARAVVRPRSEGRLAAYLLKREEPPQRRGGSSKNRAVTGKTLLTWAAGREKYRLPRGPREALTPACGSRVSERDPDLLPSYRRGGAYPAPPFGGSSNIRRSSRRSSQGLRPAEPPVAVPAQLDGATRLVVGPVAEDVDQARGVQPCAGRLGRQVVEDGRLPAVTVEAQREHARPAGRERLPAAVPDLERLFPHADGAAKPREQRVGVAPLLGGVHLSVAERAP